MASIDLNGPILADKVLADNDIVAEDVTFTLPDVSFLKGDYKATGNLSLPIPLVEAMEASITKIGLNRKLSKIQKPEPVSFEFRAVQNDLKVDGTNTQTGIKAFIRGVPNKVAGGSIEPGASWSGEITISVLRYQLIVDGEEQILIDPLKQIIKIDGTDYGQSIKSYL